MVIEGIKVRILKPNQRVKGVIMPVGAIVVIEPDLALMMIRQRKVEEISVERRDIPATLIEV